MLVAGMLRLSRRTLYRLVNLLEQAAHIRRLTLRIVALELSLVLILILRQLSEL